MDLVVKIGGSLLLTYTSHYVAANLYTQLCVPPSLWGFLQGMVTTGSPVCTAALNYVSSSQASYSTILTVTVSRLLMDMIIPGSKSA
jgi:hypothetical protein